MGICLLHGQRLSRRIGSNFSGSLFNMRPKRPLLNLSRRTPFKQSRSSDVRAHRFSQFSPRSGRQKTSSARRADGAAAAHCVGSRLPWRA